jgi:hypothetical protein
VKLSPFYGETFKGETFYTLFTARFAPFYLSVPMHCFYKDMYPGVSLTVLNKNEKDLPELTRYQREAVIGLLLGDGHISKSSKR